VVAERAAVTANGRPILADFVISGGVKNTGQYDKRSSYKMHGTLRKGINPGCIKQTAALTYRLRFRPILARGRFESANKLMKILYIALADYRPARVHGNTLINWSAPIKATTDKMTDARLPVTIIEIVKLFRCDWAGHDADFGSLECATQYVTSIASIDHLLSSLSLLAV
jgi:hypothetical protein